MKIMKENVYEDWCGQGLMRVIKGTVQKELRT